MAISRIRLALQYRLLFQLFFMVTSISRKRRHSPPRLKKKDTNYALEDDAVYVDNGKRTS
jgi:hypothetical protein